MKSSFNSVLFLIFKYLIFIFRSLPFNSTDFLKILLSNLYLYPLIFKIYPEIFLFFKLFLISSKDKLYFSGLGKSKSQFISFK